MGKLYIVPTPVGNLEDMTFRAIKVLKEVDMILAEDTRTSSVLLKHYDIQKPLSSHHKFNEHQTAEAVAQKIKAGETIALISDAGTPAISDPGFMLTRACVEAGVEVECLPGATAFVPALVDSGLPNNRFCFEGFLPQKKGRQTRLKELAEEERTIIIYESPFRVVKTLTQLAELMGEARKVSVTREISKIHEETVRGTLAEVKQHFEEHEPKGEFVIIVGGKEDEGKKAKKNKYGDDEDED
ncbi:MAG: 16S rRNA (cytidine(1402)-2'-O)-methyltransferase [Paludibacteraceae bacterium]|nr:16S rRNA (cytidine(1402)-2'-O)-methyltransferase [Paludibacteraceae bacterium]